MNRVLPYPLLAAALLLMWLLLSGFTPGQFVLGCIVAFGASWAMVPLEPSKPRIRRWRAIPRLAGIVLVDILRSNIAVASIVLLGRGSETTSGFVDIPLKLRDPTGLATLACIITTTPGTAWVDYRSANGRLLIHVLDLVDEQEWIELITQRYELLLMEIFE